MKALFLVTLVWVFLACPLAAQEWYVVQKGDTLWSISRRFGLTLDALKARNGIKDDKIKVGQRLRVGAVQVSPPAREPPAASASVGQTIRHVVAAGETLWSISRRYKVSVEALKRENGLFSDSIQKGQVLLVRGGTPSAAAAHQAKPTPAAKQTQPQKKPEAPSRTFAWPIRGTVVEKFGVAQKGIINGITIAAEQGSEVRAAAAGTVTYCGPLGGYGQVVVIRHDGEYYSVYAHLSQILVRQGSAVGVRAPVGKSGFVASAGRHGVHFQLYRKESAVNPLAYLAG